MQNEEKIQAFLEEVARFKTSDEACLPDAEDDAETLDWVIETARELLKT